MTASSPPQRVFDVESRLFKEHFDKSCFAFAHRLSNSELFETERLLDVARRMASDPSDVYYDAGTVQIGQRWTDIPMTQLSIEQLLEQITTANAWIVLRRLEKFPEYARLLDTCMAEIEERSGLDLGRLMKLRNSILFINSPHRISTYHIDRECSVLMQIRGEKTISIFDRADRDVLPEEELERFWSVDNNAAVYKPQFQDRARVYRMLPGDAVHIPTNAPHWVQNGPLVSVSLNVNFHYKDHLLADLYRANYRLRQLGLNPTPPHTSPAIDGVKRVVYQSVSALKGSRERLTQIVGGRRP